MPGTCTTEKFTTDNPAVLFEHMSDAVYLLDPETSNIVWVNKAGYEHLLMEKSEVMDHSVLSLQKDVVGPEQWKSIANVIRESKNFTFVGSHLRKDGTDFPVEVNTSCFEMDGKEYFLSVARDISNRRAREAEGLSRSNQVWFAINACADGLWDWEPATDTVFFSPPLKRMLGYGPDEMPPVIETWKNNIHPEDLSFVLQSLEEHLAGRRERYEAVYRLRNRNGHYLWVHDLGCVSERCAEGEALRVTGMVKDITDYKAQEFRLQELAAYDELTQLRNRRECTRIFEKHIELAHRTKRPISMAFFDLDFFKTVNDKYGHLAGDEVLKSVSKLVSDNMRKSDYLFRWGGEEFVLLSDNTSLSEMNILTEKLRLLISDHSITYNSNRISITASFGLASYPENAEKQNDLFLIADSNLYKAKSMGRNCICCSE